MSLRWPALELLRRGGGDLIALSPLSQTSARDAMLEALRRLDPALAHFGDGGPDVAIVEALAATVEVMGFYHDRFLTESKLGSAQLLDDLAKIVALIGYRPLPAVAATAIQFFEAITAGTVAPGTRVAGKVLAPPATVTYETDALIEISPDLNRMALSPIITRSAGALRAVVTQLIQRSPAASSSAVAAAIAALQQTAGPALPTDDFRPATMAMVADAQGLELVPVTASRSRGVAFDRALSRSFEQPSTLASRTTVIRRLRSRRALPDGLVAFEVSEAPILHRPSAAAPELLTSTLEVFVLRPGDEAQDPKEWDPALRYAEVFDFSGSEVADLHYRTFVDDALHTWILLRQAVGAHALLDDAALARVYARFIPAVGSVLPPDEPGDAEGSSLAPDLSAVTVGLAAGYFESSLVLPSVANTRLAARATWAMVDRDLGLVKDDSILIQDGDRRWIRTLSDRPAGASPRYLRWADDPPPGAASSVLPEAHAPVDAALDPATTKIGSLSDAAGGDAFPTWSEFYAQLRPPGAFQPVDDLPIVPATTGIIERQRAIAAGTTYLVLRDASHVSVGDYLLLGRRLTAPYRTPQPFGSWRWRTGEPPFDGRTPWLDAEVLQALEVRGNVVRLATPVSQDYFVHQGRLAAAAPATPLTELIVLPGVASVAAGDQLRQTLALTTRTTFRGEDNQIYDASYVSAALDHSYLAGDLRRPLVSEPPASRAARMVRLRDADPEPTTTPELQARWDALFVAVAGVAEAQAAPSWQLAVTVRADALRAPGAQIARLEDDAGAALTGDDIAALVTAESPVPLISLDAAAHIAAASDGEVVAALKAPQPAWQRAAGDTAAAGEFRVVELASFDVLPDPHALAREDVLGGGGTLVLAADPHAAGQAFPFVWDAASAAPRAQGVAPALADSFEALLLAAGQGAELAGTAVALSVDWQVAAARILDPGFRALAGAAVVAASADDQIAVECGFTGGADHVAVTGVPTGATGDPLRGAAALWAVVPGDIAVAPGGAQARWVFALDDAASPLPASVDLRLALVGPRRAIVAAHTAGDGRSAEVDALGAARGGDLGFALDALCVLEDAAIPSDQIDASTIWAWPAIDPPLEDLPEPRDSRFLAVIAGEHHPVTIAWHREEVWWDPERRTLRLPTGPLDEVPGVRPEDVVRLLQIAAPPIDHRHLAIHHDAAGDRSMLTLAMPTSWPGRELAPAPVIVAAPRGRGPHEILDLLAPVDVSVDPEGGVRWTLHVAGDARDRWREISVAIRDWAAPAERGLTVEPLWRVPAPPAWRAQAGDPAQLATRPVTLILESSGADGVVAVTAMPRLDGDAVELAPLGSDEFPAVASIARLDLATRTIAATPAQPLALSGTTTLTLEPAPAPPAAVTEAISAIAFRDGTRWRPIDVTAVTELSGGGRRYVLDRAYLSLFPDGIARVQTVRLCYATSALGPAGASTVQRVRLRFAGLGQPPARGAGANAAVFHSDDLAHRAVLDIASAPTVDGDALVVALDVDAAALAQVLDEHGAPRWTRVDLALRWPSAIAKTLVRQPLRIELGDSAPYALADGDPIAVRYGVDTVRTRLRVASGRQLDVESPAAVPPDAITLLGLRTAIAPDDYAATLELTPSSLQPPWLMSFVNQPAPPSLRDTLLPYTSADDITGDDGALRWRFRFAHRDAVIDIFQRARDPLYLFTNERGELRGDFYTRADTSLATELAIAPVPNFLDAVDDAPIDRLVLTASAWAGKDLAKQVPGGLDSRPVVLGSRGWTPPPGRSAGGAPGFIADDFPEVRVVSGERRRVATNLVMQSTRFNSGNFIPVAGQATTPASAAALIAGALRITAQPIGRDGKPVPDRVDQPVTYVALEELGAISATVSTARASKPTAPIPLNTIATMSFSEAVDARLVVDEPRYVFSASFSAAGTCTLHFLFIDEELVETVRVRIEAQYEVDPSRSGDGLSDPIYPLETALVPFDPAQRLALLAPGQLKPGALVFVRMPPAADVPALQWTRVTEVVGPIVEVSPPIEVVATAVSSPFEPIEVTGLGKLFNAAKLDAEYYTSVAKARFVKDGPLVLPLADRLPLDTVAGGSLLAALVPGDLVLVFDEHLRQAWADHRRGGIAGGTDPAWQDWPDFQHQAVVRRVDRDTGLVVLAAPLPDRFQIRWQLTGAQLTANTDDVARLRVLPHHRAPVQGPRTLAVLGSGDATRRFARFVTTLGAGTGSAVIPLDVDGVMTGNLEVLAFDPDKGAWSRWLRRDDLARAGKKEPAFALGFRPANAAGDVPVSVTFGDGVTGQLTPTGSANLYLRSTQIGAAATWLARRRRVRIAGRELADGPVEVAARIAPRRNLKLRLETAAPDELSGGRDLGAAQWRPSLALDVALPDGTVRTFVEISEDDAARGAHGFLRVDDESVPPGAIDAHLYAPIALPQGTQVIAWQLAGTRQWALDDAFYTDLARSDLTTAPGATTLQLLSTTGLRAGSRIALSPDAASPPDIATLASIDPPTWSAVVEVPLPRAYDLARAFVRGNVARVVQGSVDQTTIGSSDGATASLRLPLHNRSPLLHVVPPGGEPVPDVRVLVANQEWTRVLDFARETPASRVWRLDIDGDGHAFVVFGDGKQGAIPPAGRDNIAAIARVGDGAAGNLARGAINKLVTGNLAVKSTANLSDAAGGSAGDTPGVAREKAFARRLPSDRVVSAEDCVRAAIGTSDVITAALDPTAPTGQLALVVALADRRDPTPEDLAAVHDRVVGAMPITAAPRVQLAVVAAEQRAVHLVVEIGVGDDALPADVFVQITDAFTGPGGFFAAERWDIGEPLRLGAVYDALFQVRGVAHARVLWMAGTPLLEGERATAPAPDVFDPGPAGVVRCDGDTVNDPFGRRGTFRLEQAQEAP